MPCDNKALLKASQLAICTSGLIYKVWTSWESQRVALSLQKESRDWTLRKGFAEPTSTEAIFIDLVFGSFTLITFSLLIGHCLGDPRTVAEKLFMVIGFIAMVIVGGLLITSVDDLPDRLYDNAIILGVLAFIAGVLFLMDAGTKCQGKKKKQQQPKRAVTPKKREVEILPKVEEQTAAVVVEQKAEAKKDESKREQPKKEESTKEETTQTQNGIKSVEIRIKDPTKNWPVYSGRPTAISELDGLAEAERVDRLLQHAPEVEQEQPVLLHSRRGTALVQPSPVKHTSSFYIGGPFSWRRQGSDPGTQK